MPDAALVADPICSASWSLIGENVSPGSPPGGFVPGYSPPPPPPLPPPIVPLTKTVGTIEHQVVRLTFDEPVIVTGLASISNANGDNPCLGAVQLTATSVGYVFTAVVAIDSTFNLLASDPAVRAATGAYIAASDYDVGED